MTLTVQNTFQQFDTSIWQPINSGVKHAIGDRFRMLSEFLQAPHIIGTVASSSDRLSAKMIRMVVANANGTDRKILEIGGGTGPITKHLIRELRAGDTLDVVECMPKLAETLRELASQSSKNSQVKVHCMPIEDFKVDGRKYDHIVSTLPLNVFPEKTVAAFHRQLNADLLAEGGTYSYLELVGIQVGRVWKSVQSLWNPAPHKNLEAVLSLKKQHLEGKHVERDIVVANFPPARAVHVSG